MARKSARKRRVRGAARGGGSGAVVAGLVAGAVTLSGLLVFYIATQGDPTGIKAQVDKGFALAQGSPESVLDAYFSAKSVQGRMPLLIQSPGLSGRMAVKYKNTNFSESLKYKIDSKTKIVGQREWLAVNVTITGKNSLGATVSDGGVYYMRKIGGVYRIDWDASVGYNKTPWPTFSANLTKEPTEMRVVASLSDYFNFEFRRMSATHWSIELKDSISYKTIYGYVKKDSDSGRAIYNIVKDGQEHCITLAISFSRFASPGSDVVKIDDFVSAHWVK